VRVHVRVRRGQCDRECVCVRGVVGVWAVACVRVWVCVCVFVYACASVCACACACACARASRLSHIGVVDY